MLKRIFYIVKPLIPRQLQFAMRRFFVASNLKRFRTIWPIDPKAGDQPVWFKGWPNGKKFALVMTHDVEKSGGLAKVERLLAVDNDHGIRSSFGFVPERYPVDSAILDILRRNEKDIYVHDLNHDGKLFSTYRIFHERSYRINQYLEAWNVGGFRAGAMHHNMDWISELNITYDMSTFDTDPFEPMPDGAGTIFPFVVSAGADKRTFIEIPYTLPQDLLTLILHPARSIDIWENKLKWIVEHNGMASINVHPDYIAFQNDVPSFDKYPIEKYEQFLSHVTKQYGAIMWNVTPSEMSRFVYEAVKKQ